MDTGEMLLVLAVLVAVGTAMLLMGGIPLKRRFDMRRNGVDVDAETVRIDGVYDSDSGGTLYRYTLRFIDETDGVHEVEYHRLFHRNYTVRHPVGSTLRIRYDRNHPERIEAPGDTVVTFGWWLMVLSAILLYGIAVLLLATGGQDGAL